MSYKFDSIVNKHEADALKEMIFKRARERAKAFNEDAQSDVMDMARETFVSKNNPFSKIIENTNNINPEQQVNSKEDTIIEKEEKDDIGFPVKELKLQQNRNINSQMTANAINNNMAEAKVISVSNNINR